MQRGAVALLEAPGLEPVIHVLAGRLGDDDAQRRQDRRGRRGRHDVGGWW